jgi:prolipoprotein diacylglyceryl transferase
MTWNADPVLLTIGPFELRWYSLMFVLGFVLMGQYVQGIFRRHGKNPELVSALTTYIIIGMLLGSRLAHCFFYEPDYYLSRPLEIIKVWEGGLASHGGYAGVIIACWLFLRKHRELNFWWLLDMIAGPCLFVGGLIRIGNFFNSEIYGIPTDLPWAVRFVRVDDFLRHPAQLYEAVGYFTIAFILAWVAKHRAGKWPWGSNLALAIILSFTFRFFIEFTKDEQSHLVLTPTINMGQWLSVGFVLFGIFLLFLMKKTQPRHV